MTSNHWDKLRESGSEILLAEGEKWGRENNYPLGDRDTIVAAFVAGGQYVIEAMVAALGSPEWERGEV